MCAQIRGFQREYYKTRPYQGQPTRVNSRIFHPTFPHFHPKNTHINPIIRTIAESKVEVRNILASKLSNSMDIPKQ